MKKHTDQKTWILGAFAIIVIAVLLVVQLSSRPEQTADSQANTAHSSAQADPQNE